MDNVIIVTLTVPFVYSLYCPIVPLGVIMFEMLTQRRCFGGGSNTNEVRRNVTSKNMEQWPLDLSVSSEAMDFMHSLLEVEPLKRASCQQALRHSWLMGLDREQFARGQAQPQYASPRLMPLQHANSNATVSGQFEHNAGTQAIVIKTSQSAHDLRGLQSAMQPFIEQRKLKQQQRHFNQYEGTTSAAGNIACSRSMTDMYAPQQMQGQHRHVRHHNEAVQHQRRDDNANFNVMVYCGNGGSATGNTLALPNRRKYRGKGGNTMKQRKPRSNTLGNPNTRRLHNHWQPPQRHSVNHMVHHIRTADCDTSCTSVSSRSSVSVHDHMPESPLMTPIRTKATSRRVRFAVELPMMMRMNGMNVGI